MPVQVLVLGSYPCVRPLHGGQVRLAEVIAAYRRAGHTVQSINLYDTSAEAGQPRGPHDVEYPSTSAWRQWQGRPIPLIDDLTSGRYASQDERAYADITRLVQGAPAIVHLEQPWLLPLVLRWKREGKIPAARIVYGSQNIEAPLKQAILAHYGIAEAQAIAAEIALLEHEACRQADLILAVSDSDRRALAKLTASPVVLAANGIAPWHADRGTLPGRLCRLSAAPFALFVGSAHPPNISGFFETLGDTLGFLPPDRKICIVGSVGPHIVGHPDFLRWEPLNASRVCMFGLVDDAVLAALKTLAHVIILPITEGGGSNIKTAEALYSGKYVIGTPTSFRGFDDFLDMPGVHLAASPQAFRSTLQRLLQTSPLVPDPAWKDRRQRLLWEHTLAPMTRAVADLLARTGCPESLA